MNYKNLILSGLLLPVSCLGNISEQLTLEQLKEKQYQKLLEIRELRKIISEGDEYIRNGASIYAELIRNSAERRKRELDDLAQENDTKTLEIKELQQEIYEENNLILTELADALLGKQEFKRSLFYELFNGKDIKSAGPFSSDKFIAISIPSDLGLMMLTVTKYEKCIQELIGINSIIFQIEKRDAENKCIENQTNPSFY